MNSNQSIWNIVYEEILKKYSGAVIELWFNNFELEYFDDERALITTTSEAFVDLFNKKYAADIASIFEQTLNFHVDVKFFPKSSFKLEQALVTEAAPVKTAPAVKEQLTKEKDDEPTHDTAFVGEKDYTFDTGTRA